MTKFLASRVAGAKLGGIVAVLLIPMLVLVYFMLQSLRHDIAFAGRELDGIAFNRIVQPVMIGAARGKVPDSDMARLRSEGAALAAKLGLQNEIGGAVATLLSTGADKRFAILPLKVLLAQAGTRSNITLDSRAETYYLGAIVTTDAPGLLSNYTSASWIQSVALRDNALSAAETTNILLATGSWRQSHERLAETLAGVKLASSDPRFYQPVSELVSALAAHPGNIARLFRRSAPERLAEDLAAAAEFSSASSHIVADVDDLWNRASLRFEYLVQARLHDLWTQIYVMIATAAMACAAGIGAAAVMFYSTLRRLDAVHAAHASAEAAALELQRVSDDVIRLNRDLSENLKKLRDAQDEVVRKGRLSQLGQLTATVAHELRNPLGAVRTSAFLIERKLKGKNLGVDPQLQRISSGIVRCDSIITQLLDFARVTALSEKSLDLDGWLETFLAEETQNLPAAVKVVFEPQLAGRPVTFDPGRMSRVIVNLLSNAAEAMVGNGGEPLTDGIPDPTMTITTSSSPRGVEIAVADSGPGMSEDVRSRILEPLFTTKNFGTGLGLPAVEKILQEHGGGLEIVSAPGKGSVFTAWWPGNSMAKEAA